MKLHIPTRSEAVLLLGGPPEIAGMAILQDSLPPDFLIEAALAAEEFAWLIPRLFYDEDAGEIVGSGGFKSAPKGRTVEIGYGVATSCRCRGYATAGVQLLVAYAFASGLVDEVLAHTSAENLASQKVLIKSNFHECGKAESEDGPLVLWKKKKGA